jgi:Polymer-forming cytoskeletal
MFEKSKSVSEDWRLQPLRRSAVPLPAATLDPSKTISSISYETTVIGKIICKGVLKIYGLVEGEVIASNALIADGARIQGDILAEELTIGGRVKAIFMLSASSCRELLLSRVTSFTGRCRSMSMRGSKDARDRRTILPNHGRVLRWKARPHSRDRIP